MNDEELEQMTTELMLERKQAAEWLITHIASRQWFENRNLKVEDVAGMVPAIRQLVIEARADADKEFTMLNAQWEHRYSKLRAVATDALESLKRLPDSDKAYRVTCIQQLQNELNDEEPA